MQPQRYERAAREKKVINESDFKNQMTKFG